MSVPGFPSDQRVHVHGSATTCPAAFRGLSAISDSGKPQSRTDPGVLQRVLAVLDIAAEFYLETAQRIFKDNDLARGNFYRKGRHVDPSLLRSALFTIEGSLDETCCPGQTEAAHAPCSGIPEGRHKHLLKEGVGHYGVFAGSLFENQIYPQIRDFIAAAAKRVKVA